MKASLLSIALKSPKLNCLVNDNQEQLDIQQRKSHNAEPQIYMFERKQP